VATIGYTGFLIGPPVLGWVAEPTSLRVSLALVVVLAATIAALAPALAPRDPETTGGAEPARDERPERSVA
jgi:MFS family permease